jgi:large subunit ribosomal protein L19
MLRNRRRYPKTYLRPPCPTKNKVVPLRAARSEFKNISTMDAISFIQGQVSRETKLPAFRAGDTVIVDYRITEGEKSRIQQFRGDVIQIKGEGLTKTFTVRKISNGIGVERIFPLSSPAIDGLTIVKHGKVRRSRLFYLRDRVGKKARIKERRIK